MQIPENYYQKFEKAVLTFKFQVVFDPSLRENLHLNDPKIHQLGPNLLKLDDSTFLGKILDKKSAIAHSTASEIHNARTKILS